MTDGVKSRRRFAGPISDGPKHAPRARRTPFVLLDRGADGRRTVPAARAQHRLGGQRGGPARPHQQRPERGSAAGRARERGAGQRRAGQPRRRRGRPRDGACRQPRLPRDRQERDGAGDGQRRSGQRRAGGHPAPGADGDQDHVGGEEGRQGRQERQGDAHAEGRQDAAAAAARPTDEDRDEHAAADADQYRGPHHDGPPGRAGPLDDLVSAEPDAHPTPTPETTLPGGNR